MIPAKPTNNPENTLNIVMRVPLTAVQFMAEWESVDGEESLDEVLDNFRASLYPAENVQNMVIEEEVDTPSKHTTEDNTPDEPKDEYDPNDTFIWDEDEAELIIDDSDDDTILVERVFEVYDVEDNDSDVIELEEDNDIEVVKVVSAKEDIPTVEGALLKVINKRKPL